MDIIRVLIIDDSLVIRGLLTNIFEIDPRMTVVGAVGCAMQADQIIAKQIVDVVTLDIEMPGASGLDYLPSLVRRHIPVIMLSNQTSEDSKESVLALGLGASACFSKAQIVRAAASLCAMVVAAALQRDRRASPDQNDNIAKTVAASVPLENLIAAQGQELMRFISERIGHATRAGDAVARTRWLATGRKLDEVMKHKAALDASGAAA